MKNGVWENKRINEMQEKAYQVCKRLFALYIKYCEKAANDDGVFYQEIAEEYKHHYQGACDVYEDTFEIEFELRTEDRKKILGNMGYSTGSETMGETVLRG